LAGWAPEPVWTKRLEEKSSETLSEKLRVLLCSHTYALYNAYLGVVDFHEIWYVRIFYLPVSFKSLMIKILNIKI
jgi:hypothetical protein